MTRQARLIVHAGVLVAAWALAAPLAAHRLDEYLQATRVSINRDRVDLEIDLTAGANIASRILALIDTNQDGSVSDAEADAYAQQVVRALRVDVDGRPASITLTARQFPDPRDVRLGVGTIHLRGIANVAAADGPHHLTYLNTHLPDASVYLVNALEPSTDAIQIGPPHRDAAQRSLTLDYRVTSRAHWTSAAWSLAALAMVTILWIARKPPQHP
jgi:hypothetical protein